MSRAELSPVKTVYMEAKNPKIAATTILFRARTICLLFRIYQAEMPITKIAASTKLDEVVCKNLWTAIGENNISQKLVISIRAVSGLKTIPTGFCIQALATRIHKADKLAPMAVSQVAVRWNPLLTLFHPKNMMAIKVDSIKKARIPSIASGAPKISPTNHE